MVLNLRKESAQTLVIVADGVALKLQVNKHYHRVSVFLDAFSRCSVTVR